MQNSLKGAVCPNISRVGAAVISLAISFAVSLSAQEVLLKEDFNTDGVGTRYTLEGDLISEVAQHGANGVPDSQIGPVYWARSVQVSFVGVPGPTPARRALMAWDAAITADQISPEFFKLFDATVKWLVKDKAAATVVLAPNAAAMQSLADRLTAGGYKVEDDDTSVPADQVVGDLIIKAPGGGESRFGVTKKPVLAFSSSDHDDMLLSTIGTTASFEAGNATVVTASHPAAGGLTGSFKVATGEHNWQLMGSVLPEGAITIANFERQIPATVANLTDVDAMAAGTKQSTKATATVAQVDFADTTTGDFQVDNPIPGDVTAVWGVVVRGKITVSTTGKYSFALGMDDGARLRIDKNKNGLDSGDNVINEDATGGHRARYGDLQLDAGTYDFEVAGFNSGGAGSLEFSVSTKAGGGDTSAISSGTWEVLGSSTGAVKLQGTASVTSYVASGAPEKVSIPLVVLLNGPDEGGSVFGGGPFVGFEGSSFFAGSGLNKFSPDVATKTLTLKPVNVAGKSNLKLTVAAAGTFLDFETSDFLDFKVGEEGQDPSAFKTLIHFTAPSGNDKFFNDRTTNPSNPAKLGLRFRDVTYDIPAGYNKLVVRVEALTSWWNETIGFDNIRVTSGAAVQPQVSIQLAGGNVSVQFTGKLQSASSIAGPWTDVANATSPYVIEKSKVTGTLFLRAM